jgi:hypothetical protein
MLICLLGVRNTRQDQAIWYERRLLGKLEIPRTLEPIDERTDKGKRMMVIIDLNEMAFTELRLSIYAFSSSVKTAFGIVKSCKYKEYQDGNAAMAWEKLKKKFDPISCLRWLRQKEFSQKVN